MAIRIRHDSNIKSSSEIYALLWQRPNCEKQAIKSFTIVPHENRGLERNDWVEVEDHPENDEAQSSCERQIIANVVVVFVWSSIKRDILRTSCAAPFHLQSYQSTSRSIDCPCVSNLTQIRPISVSSEAALRTLFHHTNNTFGMFYSWHVFDL